jgi:hypothetical protein
MFGWKKGDRDNKTWEISWCVFLSTFDHAVKSRAEMSRT